MEKKSFWSGLAVGLLVAIFIASAAFTGKIIYNGLETSHISTEETSAEQKKAASIKEVEEKLDVIKEVIDENYALDPVDAKTMQEGIYKGYVESLGDPYSDYFTKEELEDQQEKMSGTYGGIGAYIGMDEESGYAKLGELYEKGPAEKAGLKKGDIIIKIDGKIAKDMALEEVVSQIRGNEGTIVTLTIMRSGESESKDYKIKREKLESKTVDSKMLEDGIAYIRIKEFDTITIEQFEKALADAKKNNMRGLVLDLRDNPGGSVSAVMEVARNILPKGIVVYTKDKNGKREDYSCDGSNELEVPLVVLVNGNSASASEILAGAIKDYKKGTLLGTTTYGKGIVQTFIPLTDGSAVKLTISKYYTPSGKNIHKIGIKPDVELEFDAERYLKDEYDNQLQKAQDILKKKISK